MANMFSVNKAERSKLRKLPLLPRIGLTVDVAGRQFTYKHAPILETLLNVRERGFSVKNLVRVASEQLAEIGFPRGAKAVSLVKDAAKAAKAGSQEAPTDTKATIVKKAPQKAAASTKKKPAKEPQPTAAL
jgi:hypothetical protein